MQFEYGVCVHVAVRQRLIRRRVKCRLHFHGGRRSSHPIFVPHLLHLSRVGVLRISPSRVHPRVYGSEWNCLGLRAECGGRG